VAVEYQKGVAEVDDIVIVTAYNHHRHTRNSCFGKVTKEKKHKATSGAKKKQKRRRSDDYEC